MLGNWGPVSLTSFEREKWEKIKILLLVSKNLCGKIVLSRGVYFSGGDLIPFSFFSWELEETKEEKARGQKRFYGCWMLWLWFGAGSKNRTNGPLAHTREKEISLNKSHLSFVKKNCF